ncbi:MAG TPA: anthranilate phosphoribosyltransferase [Candidatus Acidoferrales bacterium]|nr:anthranilate phosphoribosyltransferase [Candidatus Acidoferrales bacterium]
MRDQTEMIAEWLQKVEGGGDLSAQEAEEIMGELLEGRLEQAQIVALLTSLRSKGEAVEELVGFARAMRRRVNHGGAQAQLAPLVDTCGTGGDGGSTFNVSTAAAVVVAGAGVRVAKHGNRSFSSRCGSADVLEALGVKIDIPQERALAAIEKVGIGFLFAPNMHTAMKHAAAARREAGGRTIFNLLGPLTNPAGATAQVIGVPAPALVDKLGHALAELGTEHAFVVHGVDGIDEVSLSDETEVAEVRPHSVKCYRVKPEDFGVQRARRENLAGGDAAENAVIIRGILEGEAGPRRDFVCINAAAALVAAGRAADFREGTRLAQQAIDSGSARAKLAALIEFTRG